MHYAGDKYHSIDPCAESPTETKAPGHIFLDELGLKRGDHTTKRRRDSKKEVARQTKCRRLKQTASLGVDEEGSLGDWSDCDDEMSDLF